VSAAAVVAPAAKGGDDGNQLVVGHRKATTGRCNADDHHADHGADEPVFDGGGATLIGPDALRCGHLLHPATLVTADQRDG